MIIVDLKIENTRLMYSTTKKMEVYLLESYELAPRSDGVSGNRITTVRTDPYFLCGV